MTQILQDKFRLLFEHSSDPHLIITDGVITDCNDATIKLLGTSCKKEVLTIHPAKLSPPLQPDGRKSSEKSVEMDRIAHEKGFHRFEWVHQRLNGENFPVQVTLNSVMIDGKPGMVVVWHDLTEMKQKEESLRRANEKMKRDLEAAAAVQKAMLPVSSPLLKGLRAAWAYKPCDDLGGDNLNIFKLDERHVGLYVLDVTGHGLAASLLSVAASHFLSPYSETSFVRSLNSQNKMAIARPSEVAERLNQHFSSNPELVQLFTLLYGILDTESMEFTYICAGHPAPILVSSEKVSYGPGSGLPIGVMAAAGYAEESLKLRPGDRIYLYSDGVTEAKNIQNEFYDIRRLQLLLEDIAKLPLAESLEKIIQNIEFWCEPKEADDDITLLAVEVR